MNSEEKKIQYILVSSNKIFSFAVKSKDFNAQMSKWLKLVLKIGFQLLVQLLFLCVSESFFFLISASSIYLS